MNGGTAVIVADGGPAGTILGLLRANAGVNVTKRAAQIREWPDIGFDCMGFQLIAPANYFLIFSIYNMRLCLGFRSCLGGPRPSDTTAKR